MAAKRDLTLSFMRTQGFARMMRNGGGGAGGGEQWQ